MAHPARATQLKWRRRHAFGAIAPQVGMRFADVDTTALGDRYEIYPSPNAGSPPMNRCSVRSSSCTAAACIASRRWPRRLRPRLAPEPAAGSGAARRHRRARGAAATPPASHAAGCQRDSRRRRRFRCRTWFAEIDIDKKGEVTRADFLKYRMKSFEQLDANKDNKLSVEEFLKVVEPPLHAAMRRACRRSRSAAPAPAPSSRTSTPIATASSSAPRPRRWSIPNSTSTTPTATTRSPSPRFA